MSLFPVVISSNEPWSLNAPPEAKGIKKGWHQPKGQRDISRNYSSRFSLRLTVGLGTGDLGFRLRAFSRSENMKKEKGQRQR